MAMTKLYGVVQWMKQEDDEMASEDTASCWCLLLDSPVASSS